MSDSRGEIDITIKKLEIMPWIAKFNETLDDERSMYGKPDTEDRPVEQVLPSRRDPR